MNTLSYHIVIKTHAGYRVGDMSVDLEDEKVSGTIHAPFFEPQFCGKMNDDGTLNNTQLLSFNFTKEKGCPLE